MKISDPTLSRGCLDPISLGDDELSWDVSLAFAVSEDSQVYARVATGFRAPTIQDRLEDDPVATDRGLGDDHVL